MSVTTAIADAGARILRNRRLMRAPIWIYKARAGALLGSRVLMLEHIGRNSGARRYVVLEVIDHPARDTFVITSGFGTKAQWFRTIAANPSVRVYVGSHAPARATEADPRPGRGGSGAGGLPHQARPGVGTIEAGPRANPRQTDHRHQHGVADGGVAAGPGVMPELHRRSRC
jgi:deazaflavin-dependent oxidoreductase (nitroreductase family)